MFGSAKDVLERIGPEDRVLDLGGAVEVFPRADVVIDAQPWEARSPGQLAGEPERFTRDSWIVGDVCSPEVWSRFPDKSFDFILCSHLLEDVRDPVFICAQMIRVGRAGYIECPSRFRECARAQANDVHAGWNHHRWIVDVEGDRLVFTPKGHWVDLFDYLGEERRPRLHEHRHGFVAVHWTGSFDYVERAAKGPVKEAENLFHFYERYPYEDPRPFHEIAEVPHRGTTFEWIDGFQLPVEREVGDAELVARFRARLGPWGRRLPGLEP